MDASMSRAAEAAARSLATRLGLEVSEAVVLQDSDRVTLRLLPCDAVASVAPAAWFAHAEFEADVAQQVARAGGPAAALDPRAEPRPYLHDGFVITFWTHYAPEAGEASPEQYAEALQRLHAAMRKVDVPARHFSGRIDDAEKLIDDPARTPRLEPGDRTLLSDTLRDLREAITRRGRPEQLLHAEPHPGNVLNTANGLLFIDFETACRGPVEFDIAAMPREVSPHYPGADEQLIEDCRTLHKALVAAWRWDRDDRFPNGHEMGIEFTAQVRAALGR